MKVIFLMLLMLLPWTLKAQEAHSDTTELDERSGKSLSHDLEKGKFDIHFRSFYMQTINQGALTDYSTLAVGAGLGYLSPAWKGFQVGFSGFFVFQLFENNLTIADPTTGAGNRYEVVLYDMHDPENARDLDRLEEFFISYQKKNFKAIFGRQKVNSPMLNEQDNRMRPNIFSGLSIYHKSKKWESMGAWLTSVAIRGTVDWYKMDDSFGVYSFGRNPFGEPSGYKGNITTKGLAMAGVKYNNNGLSLQGWNYFAENVFNLNFVQGDYAHDLGEKKLLVGLQGFYQTAVNQGGNQDPKKAYILPNEKPSGLGAKLGLQSGKQEVSINFLGFMGQGRFLFPREWGREQFYVSLPRERFEGSGDVKAWTLKYKTELPMKGTKLEFGASKVNHSDIEKYAANKYGIPSYYHFTGALNYKFRGYLDGLDGQILIVNKTAQDFAAVSDAYRINRVDLWNLNVTLDYRF
ncbi:hypothetical protein P872_18620 [Rhodonellum psychrophilum GCM71 = DSM 17998]|uniref:Uncharacterized protein n=2 Tax=Rhodonellum TaxID=336827 RepID=U5BXK2_9BACT|nr:MULTISPECIES: OprD family outer membrane porin [Rhodonellum]ERM82304.1 hypothetical protein P872_18620 [Rhodonellum psychrophilum GCM71 = DSM 17998]SDZ48975.1 outer membrane porin, OprD family [Rhodonellum ikkaensis]